MLKDKILNRDSNLIFYGLTPPKSDLSNAKISEIASKQIERLKGIELDGLVLYDIQDESLRNNSPRPFPFMPTLSPDIYGRDYLKDLKLDKIIYNSVGKYSKETLELWLEENRRSFDCAVFVGSPSKNQAQSLSLSDAYKVKRELSSSIVLGGVTIPERHFKKNDEHLRVFNKMENGCDFFISQCVYNINYSKNFISDYYYAATELEKDMVPIIFTLTPCGSLKTLEFMKWLGIEIPKWMENDLNHTRNILDKSIDLCKSIALELIGYCREKNVPMGINIESVAIRKEEIEASIDLLKTVKGYLL
jgi:hypothetical protein